MKIEITDISDIETKSIDGLKLLLSDQLIDEFVQVFSSEIEEKKKKLNDRLVDLKSLRLDISKVKNGLQLVNSYLKKETVINQILTEVQYLNRFGVIYGSNKQTIKSIISSLETQTEEELDKNLKSVKQMVHENVNKVLK